MILNDIDLKLFIDMYVLEGKSPTYLAQRFRMDRTTVYKYRDRYKLISIVPKEKIYRKQPKTAQYSDYLNDYDTQKFKTQLKCEHPLWIKRCSCRQKVLESDSRVNY